MTDELRTRIDWTRRAVETLQLHHPHAAGDFERRLLGDLASEGNARLWLEADDGRSAGLLGTSAMPDNQRQRDADADCATARDVLAQHDRPVVGAMIERGIEADPIIKASQPPHDPMSREQVNLLADAAAAITKLESALGSEAERQSGKA